MSLLGGLNLLAFLHVQSIAFVASRYDGLDELQLLFSQLFQTFWPIILVVLTGVIVIGLVPGARRWLGGIFRT